MKERKPLLFIVDDEPSLCRLLEFKLANTIDAKVRIFSNAEACLNALDDEPDCVLLDLMMPGIDGTEALKEIKRRSAQTPVIIISAQGSIDVAVQTLKHGASDYFTKPVDYDRLSHSIRTAMKLTELTKEVQSLRDTLRRSVHFENIITNCGKMHEILRMTEKIKNSTISVLLQGESGTGKELIARAVHFNGVRKNAPFVTINCAAIPANLLESELFGFEKGAFTGAHERKIGKFQAAHSGTLFLDEISEMDLQLQAKLLRVLQTKQFERLGGNETFSVDVRIVASTNRDLFQEVQQHRFREDLYYRLAAFPLRLPSLRERTGDIPLLAEHFLRRFAKEHERPDLTFTQEAMQFLQEYHWPGNVRELENAIERAVLISDSDQIVALDFPLTLFDTRQNGKSAFKTNGTHAAHEDEDILPMETLKEHAVKRALRVTKGNVVLAANKLEISRSTLYDLIAKYRIVLER